MTFDFSADFTVDKVSQCLPGNSNINDWFAAMVANLPTFEIITPARIAAFLAQTGHESSNYTQLHENLNYRADALCRVWPRYFNSSNANDYAHNPEKIANRAYANRLGNGPEESGDGWKFRGRGPIQITGKDNYQACSQYVYGDDRLLDNPDMLEQDYDASIKSACWFWTRAKLNDYVDANNFRETTHRINGGYIGEDDREARYGRALQTFGE